MAKKGKILVLQIDFSSFNYMCPTEEFSDIGEDNEEITRAGVIDGVFKPSCTTSSFSGTTTTSAKQHQNPHPQKEHNKKKNSMWPIRSGDGPIIVPKEHGTKI